MDATSCHRLARKVDEVLHVLRDDDPPFPDRERQHLLIGEAGEPRIRIERENVVTALRQRTPDTSTGDVCVQEEPQLGVAWHSHDPGCWKLLKPILERALVICDRILDFIVKTPRVRER